MSDKHAIIFGVTGQDGSYLAELLLAKDYHVVGVSRRTSSPNDERIRHLRDNSRLRLVSGDVTDAHSVQRIIAAVSDKSSWTEIYNLAAMSHVGVSFDEPAHTTAVTYGGALNILESVRLLDNKSIRLYQASSSEMFGAARSWRMTEPEMFNDGHHDPEKIGEYYQNEDTPFIPCSPYAIAKLAAHHAIRLYREAYGIFACSGILMNHESPRRSETFVTRKITRHLARLSLGKTTTKLRLGNLEACRDWGHARDYVEAMWLMLQKPTASDYVVATGETHTVREFLEEACGLLGVKADEVYEIDPALLRPSEVPYLRGDASKARRELQWAPRTTFKQLVHEMLEADIAALYTGGCCGCP